MLTEDVEDSHYNFVMLFPGLAAEDEDVVHVDGHYSLIDEFLEDVVHHCLECGRTVHEAEEHDQSFEKASVHLKGGVGRGWVFGCKSTDVYPAFTSE